jgi:thiamine pyrophosphokinase
LRTVIFANGSITNPNHITSWLRATDTLIGADGGTAHCVALGLTPNVVVGDLDSIDPVLVARLTTAGVIFERHAPAKDQTDLELAVERALRDGATEIILLGATGGRLDQTLANLLILAQRPWPAQIKLVDERQVAQLLRGPGQIVLDAPIGATVSAIPLSPTVRGIVYSGLLYPLQDATLTLGSTRGVSNVVEHTPAAIAVRDGLLLIVQEMLGSAPEIM